MSKKSIKTNVLLNAIKTIMSLVFPLITFPYASRVLSPEGIGRVNFANQYIQYFTMIASLGVSGYGIREAAKLRNDRHGLTKFVKEVFKINMISTAIAYVLLFASIALIPKLHGYRDVLIVCSLVIVFTTLGMDWLYSALEDFFYITVRSVIFQLISLVLLFTFVKSPDDYVKYAAIISFSNVGSNALNFIHSRKYILWKEKIRYSLSTHIKPIMVLFATAVTSSIYTMLDTTMLGFISNDWEVGIYTAATKVNRLTVSLVTSVSTVLLPRLSYYHGNKENEEFKRLAYKSVNLILLLAVPAVIGLSILSKPVILILSGREYLDAIPVMRAMNPIIIIVGLSNFTGVQLFLSYGKEKWTLYSDLAGASVNFIMNAILIPKCGAFGAAVASVCAEATVTSMQLIMARKFVKILPIFKSLLYYFGCSIIMGATVLVIYRWISNIILQMVISILTGVIVYTLILIVSKNELVIEIINILRSRIKNRVNNK